MHQIEPFITLKTKQNDYIQELIKRLNIEYEKQDRSGVYGYVQRNLAYNSNRIEGSTLTKEQTASLFDTQTIIANNEVIKSKDIEEMSGHFLMFNYMLNTLEETLSEDLIKQFHYHLKIGVFEDKANGYPCGEYKNRENYVADIKTISPHLVSDKMQELIHNYHNDTQKTFRDIILLHAKYEAIHPFQDGNGRTGRLILFRECLKNNMIPPIIKEQNKPLYIKGLNNYQKNIDNGESLIKLCQNEQEDFYNNTVNMVFDYEIQKVQSNDNQNVSDTINLQQTVN